MLLGTLLGIQDSTQDVQYLWKTRCLVSVDFSSDDQLGNSGIVISLDNLVAATVT